jgi:hypothetical protein
VDVLEVRPRNSYYSGVCLRFQRKDEGALLVVWKSEK